MGEDELDALLRQVPDHPPLGAPSLHGQRAAERVFARTERSGEPLAPDDAAYLALANDPAARRWLLRQALRRRRTRVWGAVGGLFAAAACLFILVSPRSEALDFELRGFVRGYRGSPPEAPSRMAGCTRSACVVPSSRLRIELADPRPAAVLIGREGHSWRVAAEIPPDAPVLPVEALLGDAFGTYALLVVPVDQASQWEGEPVSTTTLEPSRVFEYVPAPHLEMAP